MALIKLSNETAPAYEAARLSALNEYSILDTEAEIDYDDIAKLAAFVCNSPISLITLIDEKRQWFKARVGVSITEMPREISLCTHTIEQHDMVIVSDVTKDERFCNHPMASNSFGLKFYAGIPLTTPTGFNLGTICIIDKEPKELAPEQKSTLQALSRQVIQLLEARKQNQELKRLYQRNSRLLSIIGHDLKAPLNSVDGMLQLLDTDLISDHEFTEYIARLRKTVGASQHLLANLLSWASSQLVEKSAAREVLSLKEIVDNITNDNIELFKAKGNQVKNNLEAMSPVMANKNMVEFVLRNLLLNANKFTDKGTITIGLTEHKNSVEVTVSDTGLGIKEEVLQNLFSWKERKSTQGTRGEKGSGLGLPVCREFIEEMGGRIWLTTKLNSGTSFYFTLPKADGFPERDGLSARTKVSNS
ncbi:MAG: GAF domain-containing sensor histidine kinase [Bacteroidota bacterium]